MSEVRVVGSSSSAVDLPEILRYVSNGLIATGVHYGVLSVNLQILEMQSAGLANLIAAILGIATSFLGSRYFVFRNHEGGLYRQARSFLLLYAFIASLHGLTLFLWTDVSGFDYRIGFLLATCIQVAISYWGNKRLVFKL